MNIDLERKCMVKEKNYFIILWSFKLFYKKLRQKLKYKHVFALKELRLQNRSAIFFKVF